MNVARDFFDIDKDALSVDELIALEREYTRQEVARRYRLRAEVEASEELQALTLAYFRSDPLDPERCIRWINDWMWSTNPRNFRRSIPARVPVRLYPMQEDAIRTIFQWFRDGEIGLIEKTRSMGATVIIPAGVFVYLWLFLEDFQGGVGSRKLDLVDRKGDPDSIFEKIRGTLRSLPKWMMPRGFKARDHDKVATLVNPANGAAITGEGGANIGRGGRKTLYFIDEGASVDDQESAEAALSETADTVIWCSTPKGRGNHFAMMRHSGTVPVLTMHWREHPFRNQAWYDGMCAKFAHNKALVAQELDISYTASVDRVVIPSEWVQAAIEYAEAIAAGGERRAGYDVALWGGDENVYVSRTGPAVGTIEAWTGDTDVDGGMHAAYAARLARADGVEAMCYDVVGVGAAAMGEFRRQEEGLGSGQNLGFTAIAINGAEAASDRHYDDVPEYPARARFVNRRTELHWSLRRRFQKTYERRRWHDHGDHAQGRDWPIEECISIPDDPTLIAQLSVATWALRGDGRVYVASKDEMKRDGIKSPDRADGLMYAFADAGAAAWWV